MKSCDMCGGRAIALKEDEEGKPKYACLRCNTTHTTVKGAACGCVVTSTTSRDITEEEIAEAKAKV